MSTPNERAAKYRDALNFCYKLGVAPYELVAFAELVGVETFHEGLDADQRPPLRKLVEEYFQSGLDAGELLRDTALRLFDELYDKPHVLNEEK